MSAAGDSILEVRELSKRFAVRDPLNRVVGQLRAVDGVSFSLGVGETLGLVGESGCGKSTLGKTLMGIYRANGGDVHFNGRTLTGSSRREHRSVRKELQYVYQDPGASLDPRWKIKHSLIEPLIIHHPGMSRQERMERVRRTLAAVGLRPEHLELYPHELSGGQQRRVGLARILTLQPKLVILDEPTSGLDVSVQATILKLLRHLQATFALTYLFISHDLSVVRIMCGRVAVMYLGKIVELAETEALFNDPQHPYTRSLLAAIPQPGGRKISQDFWLEGEPPDPMQLPSGCHFRTRCPLAEPRCAEEEPALRDLGGRVAACHLV